MDHSRVKRAPALGGFSLPYDGVNKQEGGGGNQTVLTKGERLPLRDILRLYD